MNAKRKKPLRHGINLGIFTLVFCMLLTFIGPTAFAATISPTDGNVGDRLTITSTTPSDTAYTEKDATWTISDNIVQVRIEGDTQNTKAYSTAIGILSASGKAETVTISYSISAAILSGTAPSKILINGTEIMNMDLATYEGDDFSIFENYSDSDTTGEITIPVSGTPVTIEVYTDALPESYVDLYLTFNFAATGAQVTFQPGDATTGSYKVTDADGNVHTVDKDTSISVPEAGVTLNATPASGYKLIGWKDASTGKYVKYEPEYASGTDVVFTVSDACSVYPVFIPSDQAYIFELVSAGTKYYTWEDAFSHAGTSDTVRLLTTTELPTTLAANGLTEGSTYVKSTDGVNVSEYVMTSGQKLLIPYTETDTGKWAINDSTPPDKSASRAVPKVFRTLTVPQNVKITCAGSINVNSTQATTGTDSNPGGTNGNYGHIQLKSGAELELESGALLTCYGYITGEGTVVANSGSSVAELFDLADWRGGSALTAWNSNKVAFPFTQFYIQNIESKYEMHTNMTSYIWIGISAGGEEFQSLQKLIASDTGLFRITSGTVLRWYNSSSHRMHYDIYGTVSVAGMQMSVKTSLATVDINSGSYVTPLNSLMTVRVMNGGNLTVGANFRLLPNAKIDVQTGGKMEIAAGKSLILYDYNHWKDLRFVYSVQNLRPPYYCATTEETISKSMADTSASLNVDGELIVHGNLYTTSKVEGSWPYISGTTGTVIKQAKVSRTSKNTSATDLSKFITGNGTISNDTAFGTSTFKELYQWVGPVQITLGSLTYDSPDKTTQALEPLTITCAPAIGNLAGASTNPTAFGATTYYGTGANNNHLWYTSKVKTEATCTADAYYTYSASGATNYVETISGTALGHSWGNWTETTAATCEADGVETRTCSRCGETETQPIPMLGHAWGTPTYEWIADGTQCTATRVCTRDTTHVETETKGEVTDSKAPTCTDADYTKYTADFVNDAFETKINTVDIEALGHSYESVVTAPTCTSGGYTTYTCACGDSYKDDEVAALGHTPGDAVVENRKDPTFDEAGSYDSVVYCSVCGSEISRTKKEIPQKIAVAQIDNTKYESLQEALDAVIEGDTIVLLVDKGENVLFNKCITLDISAVSGYEIKCAKGYEAVDKGDDIYLIHNTTLFDIYASNIKAGDSLDLYFYIKTADLKGVAKENFTAVITRYRQGVADDPIEIAGADWEVVDSMVRFCYDGIAAKEMTDKVFVTIYNGEQQVSNVRMETIANYAYRVLTKNKSVKEAEDGTEEAALRTTLVDMLNYGAACQKYFEDYNINDLANAKIEEFTQYATPDGDAEPVNNQTGGTGYIKGTSVSAKSSLVYTFYFDSASITKDMKADVSYVDHYGTAVKLSTITGDAFNTTKTGMIGVDVTGLAVADGKQIITCVITDSDGTEVTTVQGSVESYTYVAIKNSADDKVVFQNLMKFIVSAHNYFHFDDTTT